LPAFGQQVVVMELGKRHDTTPQRTFARANLLQAFSGLVVSVADLLRTCYWEIANLLRTCYGKTGVMDFGLNDAMSMAVAVCLGFSACVTVLTDARR